MQKLKILFQDENIAVIYKGEHLLTVPFEGAGNRIKTAQSVLEEILRKSGRYSLKHKPFAVHRLDRETSGVMMFALNERARKVIMDGWQKIVTQRSYRALAENPPRQFRGVQLKEGGVIESALAYNAYNIAFVPRAGEERKFKTVSAVTHYKKIAVGKRFTLFELDLDTGRKNQIRAHLASAGFVIEGDKNYKARGDEFGRLCLHARVLEFIHPWTEEKMRFEIPEPDEWIKACN